ncbi:hypothetical protein [Hyphomicrobium sp.]|uniref:hypothetical protein n=1 Tax=Hyphomicrobium sp. TaxID=82 RepID=UPI000FA9EB5E|nr:hypothetical protein [Hyphomicrobium sp.]RUO98027.1 MAG: hypothetical protein EKK30_15000 [Hyphomicrobium sp.]
MDTNVLVTAGHKLIDLLEAKGFKARAAMWVHNSDVETWKLWIVGPKNFTDQRTFYRKVSEAISQNKQDFPGIDASYLELIPDSHEAIRGLSKFARVTGKSSVFMQNNRFNNFYLADGIILLMDP